jgi:hypothetical protein
VASAAPAAGFLDSFFLSANSFRMASERHAPSRSAVEPDPIKRHALNRELLEAAAKGDAQAIDRALAGGADPLAPLTAGMSAFAAAIFFGRFRAMERLAGVSDLNARDDMARTPLMLAVQQGGLDAIELLRERCDVDARDPRGRTALMLAVLHRSASCVEAIVDWADLWARDEQGKTAFDLAAGLGETALLRALEASLRRREPGQLAQAAGAAQADEPRAAKRPRAL